jgi:acetoin utilization deacetylase AcuC-like enzyme
MKLAIGYDDACLEHVCRGYHPERPERLVELRQALHDAGYWDRAEHLPSREATFEELTRVHRPDYVTNTLERVQEGYGNLDPDTFFSPGTERAALISAGAAIDVAHHLWHGRADLGLCLTRPPGHHAEAHRAAGFCLFNNVGVAAASLLADEAKRVLIFDWDVHHGNGTQHQFETSAQVLYVSVHAWPHFPGTGLAHEVGTDQGEGYTANVPYPHGANDGDYVQVMERLVRPLAEAYRPDMILVSAGFDAHRRDQLGGMQLTRSAFAYMAAVMQELAHELCQGRIALFLEGGYDVKGLKRSLVEVLRVFEGADAPRPDTTPTAAHQRVLAETLRHLRPFWPVLA